MSIYKRAAILAVVGLIAAVVTAVAAVGPQAKRGSVGANNAAAEPICPQAPWPFGCQWDEPKQKLAHKRHSSQRHDGARQRPHPRPDLQLTEAEAASL